MITILTWREWSSLYGWATGCRCEPEKLQINRMYQECLFENCLEELSREIGMDKKEIQPAIFADPAAGISLCTKDDERFLVSEIKRSKSETYYHGRLSFCYDSDRVVLVAGKSFLTGTLLVSGTDDQGEARPVDAGVFNDFLEYVRKGRAVLTVGDNVYPLFSLDPQFSIV